MLAKNLPKKTHIWEVVAEGFTLLIVFAGIYFVWALLYTFGG